MVTLRSVTGRSVVNDQRCHDTTRTVVSVTKIAVLLSRDNQPDWVIAAMCGMHPSVLSRYRTGSRQVGNRHAVSLAQHFGLTIDDVRGLADDAWRQRISV